MRCSMFVLPIFGVYLVIQPSNSGIICGENQYAIINSTGTVQRCLPCDTCHKGFGLHPKCGSTLEDPPTTACHACKTGTFSSADDSSPCKACHQCAEHEIKTAECTNKNDTECSGKCEKGYFMSETLRNCQECSACCSDGKDEKIKECVSQGITNKECSPRLDKICAGQLAGRTTTTTSTTTTTITTITDATKRSGGLAMEHWIIIIVVIIVATLAIFMIVMVYMYFRLKRRSSAREQKNGSANTVSQAYASQGLQTELRVVTERTAHSASNPFYLATPTLDARNPKPTAAKETQKPEDSNSSVKNPSMSRQGSQDSQTNGEHRKRSFSLRSTTDVLQKLTTKKGDLLIEPEEGGETHEPIKIIKHPESKTVDEGSKVQMECKLEKKSQQFLYQWYRDDGSAVNGKIESVLVLDSVELKDFGSYYCRVSYEDSFGEVDTKPAKLKVRPIPGRNGMRPKCLSEVNFFSLDSVPSLLGSEKRCLGNWRGIGSTYGMKDHELDDLANAAPSERGRGVLEFLKTSQPSLTVYDFCRTLKEETFKRFDIVKKLENHFLVESCRDQGN